MPSPRPRPATREGREAGEHPALDGTHGLAEPLRELRLREPAVVRELERLTLRIRKLLQRVLHALPLETQPRVLVARVADGLRRELERVRATPLLTADDVDGAAVRERQDPRRRLRTLGHEP